MSLKHIDSIVTMRMSAIVLMITTGDTMTEKELVILSAALFLTTYSIWIESDGWAGLFAYSILTFIMYMALWGASEFLTKILQNFPL